jgi:hypothetical protein
MSLMSIPNSINEQLNEMFEELYSQTETEFEVEPNVTEVEHQSRDGFIPFTNGGGHLVATIDLAHLHGMGKDFVNEEVSNELEKVLDNCYRDSREQFIANNRERLSKMFTAELLDSNSDKINYHSLYDLKAGELAEELSETEYEWMSTALFVEHRVQFYAADNYRNETGQDEICFLSGVNLDFEYGRDKGLVTTFEKTVPVNDLSINMFKDITKQMLESI